jgi:thioredoxin-like negative regulator of GroEL
MVSECILLGIIIRAGKVLGERMDTSQLIQQAIELGNAGEKSEARRILAQVVQQEPKNARAWYLLSQLVVKQDQVVYCLSKVIEIEPDNQKAFERLQQITKETSPQAQQVQEPISLIPPPVQQATVVE